VTNERYILTEQVQRNLSDLARIVSLCDHPLLIQVKAMTTIYAARACSRKFWVADPDLRIRIGSGSNSGTDSFFQ
jgi:hypothetical protein